MAGFPEANLHQKLGAAFLLHDTRLRLVELLLLSVAALSL
jgi:hypothetical protein